MKVSAESWREELALAVRAERKRQELRQQDCAERAGIAQSTWSRFESGQQVIDVESLVGGLGVDGARIVIEALRPLPGEWR